MAARPQYRPRQPRFLRNHFRQRFPALEALYAERYASFYGKFRLPLIAHAASAFRLCGDFRQGIARIRCPDCGYDFFRPFSCRSFFLCPSCAQKRTLLLGHYLSGNLLLNYFSQAAGRPTQGAMVSSHQTFGSFPVWNPHWHTIVLEGGFDRCDRFSFIPIGASEALTEIWRQGRKAWARLLAMIWPSTVGDLPMRDEPFPSMDHHPRPSGLSPG